MTKTKTPIASAALVLDPRDGSPPRIYTLQWGQPCPWMVTVARDGRTVTLHDVERALEAGDAFGRWLGEALTARGFQLDVTRLATVGRSWERPAHLPYTVCVPEVDLRPVTVGFDLRLHPIDATLPEVEVVRARFLDRHGREVTVTGHPVEVAVALRRAGYGVAQ